MFSIISKGLWISRKDKWPYGLATDQLLAIVFCSATLSAETLTAGLSTIESTILGSMIKVCNGFPSRHFRLRVRNTQNSHPAKHQSQQQWTGGYSWAVSELSITCIHSCWIIGLGRSNASHICVQSALKDTDTNSKLRHSFQRTMTSRSYWGPTSCDADDPHVDPL